MSCNPTPDASNHQPHPEPDAVTPRLPRAVLWDMDGTLVDTEPYWMEQERALVERFGGTWTHDDATALVGNPLLVSAEYIRTHSPVDLTDHQIVDTLQSGVIDHLRHELPWRPGAHELLSELTQLGVPCALVTMSWRAMVDVFLDALPADTFTCVVTGDAVVNGKPHPEPYLRAARGLGVDPHDCVAIEDSATGARSALASGARTLVVPHVVDVPDLDGLTKIDTLSGVRAADLWAATA